MSIITRMLRGSCIYFENSGLDGFGGCTFENGVDIDCRWEEVQTLFVNLEGKEETAKSIVYVAQDMNVGDFLYNGAVADLVDPTVNPQDLTGALEIRSFAKLPTLKYNEYLRTCYLK